MLTTSKKRINPIFDNVFPNRNQLGFSAKGGIGISTRLLDVSRRDDVSATFRNTLAQSARLLRSEIQASGRFSKAPNVEKVRNRMQELYRQRKDSKYNDRALPLPPVQKRKRLNLNAGRVDLTEKLKDRNHSRFFDDM